MPKIESILRNENELERINKDREKRFGVDHDITTDEYISWLDTEEGKYFVRTKVNARVMDNYWRLNAKKLELIIDYSESHEE